VHCKCVYVPYKGIYNISEHVLFAPWTPCNFHNSRFYYTPNAMCQLRMPSLPCVQSRENDHSQNFSFPMCILHQIFVLVACGCGSILLWQHCNMLSTSGFHHVFTHNGFFSPHNLYAQNLTTFPSRPKSLNDTNRTLRLTSQLVQSTCLFDDMMCPKSCFSTFRLRPSMT